MEQHDSSRDCRVRTNNTVIKAKIPEFTDTRIISGFSQPKLAGRTKLTASFISQLERGKRNIGPVAAKKICEALQVEFGAIFKIEHMDGHAMQQRA